MIKKKKGPYQNIEFMFQLIYVIEGSSALVNEKGGRAAGQRIDT